MLSVVLDITCDLCDHDHLSQQEAGGRGGVSCGTTIKTLGGNAKGDDIIKKKTKTKPDQMFPGQRQNIQWFDLVITR